MATEKAYQYKYPNESYSGCDMVASISYSFDAVDENGNTSTKHMTYTLGELQTISYSIHMEKRPVRSIGNVNSKDYVMGQRTIAGSLVFAVFNKHFAKNLIADTNGLFKEGQTFLVDELPPFNIIVSFANEYGLRSRLIIYGIRLLNEGQVMSVNDVYTENTYQFMATDIEYMNDENGYESGRSGVFLQIKESGSSDSTSRSIDTDKISKEISKSKNEGSAVESIKMSAVAKGATKTDGKGSVLITLEPKQTTGTIVITNDEKKTVSIIEVNGAKQYVVPLGAPMAYRASFSKADPESWTCNECNFYIPGYKNPYSTKLYTPVIDSVTDATMQVYSNEPTHTHVAVRTSAGTTYHEIKSRKCFIEKLKASTTYYIATCNGKDTLASPEVKVKTLHAFEQPFISFKSMVDHNIRLFRYTEITRYYSVIDEAYELALKASKFSSVTNYITQVKKKYQTLLSKVGKDDDRYLEYSQHIHACNELIYVANMMQNKTISSINKESDVPTPTKSYNEAYENILHYSDNITKAEIFRIYNNHVQSAQNTSPGALKKINGIDNSLRYIGRSGLNHYTQALIDGIRSPKLEFYEMTPDEKQQMIENDEKKDSITLADQNSIMTSIKSELGISDDELLSRAFMVRVKSIDSAKLLDVNIVSNEEEEIALSTNISRIVSDPSVKFFVSVASKSDITLDDFIYKKEINCESEEVVLDAVEFGLIKDECYSIWIEDEYYNQISNVTTFKMANGNTTNDIEMFEIEIAKIVQDLKSSTSKTLPTSVYSELCAEIEYSDDITKTNVVDKALASIMCSGASFSTIADALSSIKYYIGFMSACDNIISNISYKNKVYSYNSSKEVTSIIITASNNEVAYHKEESMTIDLSRYDGESAIVLAVTPDLKFKSSIAFINLKTNRMEVL